MIKPTFSLHHGDCIEVMRSLPAESVDTIITSPPYAEQRKSTYGGIRESDYPTWTVAWMAEAWRIVKPGGSVLINIRPHVRGGQISDFTLRTRLALREDGWFEIDELIWHKTSSMPTFPYTRPRRAWESIHWFAKAKDPYADPKANGQPSKRIGRPDKARAEREGWDHIRLAPSTELREGVARSTDVASFSVGDGDSKGWAHPAKFPPSLAEWLGRLTCPPGGTILDPFNGSGSTGVAAIRNGWDYIGIDSVEEYIHMSRKRLEGEVA